MTEQEWNKDKDRIIDILASKCQTVEYQGRVYYRIEDPDNKNGKLFVTYFWEK